MTSHSFLTGIFGFDPPSYSDMEDVGTIDVCVRRFQGIVVAGNVIRIDLTLIQGVSLGGDAEG